MGLSTGSNDKLGPVFQRLRFEANSLYEEVKNSNPCLSQEELAVKFLKRWSEKIETIGREVAEQLPEQSFRRIYGKCLQIGAEILGNIS